jgi:hypothetical protein
MNSSTDTNASLDIAVRPYRSMDVSSPTPWSRLWESTKAIATLDKLLLLVAIGVGGFLRLVNINTLGYNTDEAVYAGQAAGIVGDPTLSQFFPIIRAHPMLFQFVVSLGFLFGVNDLTGRLFSAAVGLATIYLVYKLGSLLYGPAAGAISALIIAIMPYHVVVTRQLLLDGPMTFCATLSLYLVARFATEQRPRWLYAAGVAMGLTFLTKETGIIVIGAIYVFLALCPQIRVRLRDLVISIACMIGIISSYPLSLIFAGGEGTKKAQSYLIWQLFRRPNHDWTFYGTTAPFAIGLGVILIAVVGLWLLRGERTWREQLLVAWVIVPVFFFQLWPTKGFQYLLPTAPALAILAARTLALWSPTLEEGRQRLGQLLLRRWLKPVLVGLLALTLIAPSWSLVQASVSDQFLAGSGGVPGGREAGLWIRANVPVGAKLMTIGPSMANILQFYGHRKAYGLSVSPNPLHRNPSYEAIRNPDQSIRSSNLQYVVWDSFSASRSPFFSNSLKRFADQYHGRVVYEQSITIEGPDGSKVAKPIIIIYEVRP